MHRTPLSQQTAASQMLNGVGITSTSTINGSDPSQQTESVSSDAANKMREKLAALEDLNELLEEPVEEQVSSIFFY